MAAKATNNRGSFLLLLGLVVIGQRFLPASTWTDALRYSTDVGLLIFFLVRIREGYLRRRPYWTRDSWRQFGHAFMFFAGSAVAALVLTYLFDLRIIKAGAAQSITRGLWTAGILVLLLIGGVGLGSVTGWLADGDPSRQFAWSPRRFWSSKPRPAA